MAIKVGVKELCEQLGFAALEEGRGEICFETSEISRPGLQFTGFYEKFGRKRVQLIGNAEMFYLYSLTPEELGERMEHFMSLGVPCIVCARDNDPPEILLRHARDYGVPVFRSGKVTDRVGHDISSFIQAKLAPRIMLHGDLLDVYGIGVLLRGESGSGKSETALELIRSGHRLVADDVVEVSQVGERLVGRAPEATKHIMEIRGVGFIDVRYLYGMGAILDEKQIELVIDLEYLADYMKAGRTYDSEEYAEILGVSVPKTVLPVSPGRNLAVVVEVAARNFRLRHMGYDTGRAFRERMHKDTAKDRHRS